MVVRSPESDTHADRTESVENGHGEPVGRRLLGIALLPSAATLCNLLCGVLAIVCALFAVRGEVPGIPVVTRSSPLAEFFPTYIAGGAYLCVMAMIFDALDGRLARLARRTTEFGAQLDSLADIVSFGAAPVILFSAILLKAAAADPASVPTWQWRISLVAALVFVSCAAIRLARYNVENTRDESAQNRFCGLPSPGAAAAVLALIILHEDFLAGNLATTAGTWAVPLRWVIAAMCAAVGLLMVSRLDYVHVFNVYVRREQPPIHLVWLVLALGIAWFSPQVLLVVLAYAYLVSGLALNLRRPKCT